MKPLNLPQLSQEALLNGASMFLIPISRELIENKVGKVIALEERDNKTFVLKYEKSKNSYSSFDVCYDIEFFSPYQIGDGVYFKYEKNWIDGLPDGKSYYYNTTIKDVKVVRVQDIDYSDKFGFTEFDVTRFGYVGNWYNKQYGNYEDNPYVFLYEVKKWKNK